MLKYLTKISMDIFPSVLATIIGAYIVNHYINAKPAPDTPAAAVAPAQTKNGKPTDVANLPAPGIKAKGISEKSVMDKPVADKAPADKPAADKPAADKPAEKAADQPAEAKAADETPAAPRGRQPAPKTVAKSSPASSPAPVVSAPASAAPAGEANAATAAAPANQDANDLARAAIERLRKSPEGKSAEKPVEAAPQEAARVQESPRVVTTAPQVVRPLPPPITVSTPASEPYASSPANPPYTASVGSDDANRLTPPADIPVPVLAPPLDLRADAAGSMPNPVSKPKTNVADEMLSGVKSMFNAVLPKNVTPN
ncbi:hypothetical protein [Bradyrhizobium liaoningense]|uniref:hypothetical protein n=1 Tax=Bradyrhizobium liaoningense TaxID=43992 RepID=UPI001BA64BBD|nr:hypothetical protein [Bradyrhizobium liaoningense]MBR0718168.1 hypothetical protein [Bradyrhizobium liaoningense]